MPLIPESGTTPFGDVYRTVIDPPLTRIAGCPCARVLLQTPEGEREVGYISFRTGYGLFGEVNHNGKVIAQVHADPGLVVDEMIERAGHARRTY